MTGKIKFKKEYEHAKINIPEMRIYGLTRETLTDEIASTIIKRGHAGYFDLPVTDDEEAVKSSDEVAEENGTGSAFISKRKNKRGKR